MESALPNRTLGMIPIALLALLPSGAGVMRAPHWFDTGSDFLKQGLLLLPIIGVTAFFRGAFVAAIALLYVVFACGTFPGRSRAKRVGALAAGISIVLVVNTVVQGETLAGALLWPIVALVMLLPLFSIRSASVHPSKNGREGKSQREI